MFRVRSSSNNGQKIAQPKGAGMAVALDVKAFREATMTIDDQEHQIWNKAPRKRELARTFFADRRARSRT
jgi:hypothetical protein